MKEAYEFLAKGGILMIPILLSSIVAFTIFLERLWALQRQKILPPQFIKRVTENLRTERFEAAKAMCDRNYSPVSSIIRAGIKMHNNTRSVIKEVMEETGRREIASMERWVGAVGSIANIAPLLGLLGTVTGMIKVFQDVALVGDSGDVNPGNLANGIWEALITTAAGLSVAIPVLVMFKFINSRIDRYVIELEEVSLGLVDILAADVVMAQASPSQPVRPVEKASTVEKAINVDEVKSVPDPLPDAGGDGT